MIEILNLADVSLDNILKERRAEEKDVSKSVGDILANVRENGDKALFEYAKLFDNAALNSLKVSEEEIEKAVEEAGGEFMSVLHEAAENIKAYHSCQKRQAYVKIDKPGVVMGQKITALETVGLYVPGGTAAYPSTVLMSAIPAKIAGVENLYICTPPLKDGSVNPGILAAAKAAGVENIYKCGGAQAVAAMAYGSETIRKADKITGPGNIYVATAKKMVYGEVDIDMIAGPSDILIIADESANATYAAADMIAQAEHDKLAASILITTSKAFAKEVLLELERQLALLPRKEIAQSSLENFGRIIISDSVESAVKASNILCPEHLELCVKEPFTYLPLVKNAGSIFLGSNTPEALGDYFAGPNHTLPTMGTARFYSPLSVDDYIKKSSFLYYSEEILEEEGKKIMLFAKAEGLDGHARSIELRLKNKQ